MGAVPVYSITSLSDLVKSVFDVSFDKGYYNGSSLQYYAEVCNHLLSSKDFYASLAIRTRPRRDHKQ